MTSAVVLEDGIPQHVLLDAWWWLSQFTAEVKQRCTLMRYGMRMMGMMMVMVMWWHQHILHRRLKQALQHAAGATMLQTFVCRQGVLGAIASVAKLTDIQCVRLFVFVLEVPLQRVIARKGTPAVRTFLRFIDAATGGRGHTQRQLRGIVAGRRHTCGSSAARTWWRGMQVKRDDTIVHIATGGMAYHRSKR